MGHCSYTDRNWFWLRDFQGSGWGGEQGDEHNCRYLHLFVGRMWCVSRLFLVYVKQTLL